MEDNNDDTVLDGESGDGEGSRRCCRADENVDDSNDVKDDEDAGNNSDDILDVALKIPSVRVDAERAWTVRRREFVLEDRRELTTLPTLECSLGEAWSLLFLLPLGQTAAADDAEAAGSESTRVCVLGEYS